MKLEAWASVSHTIVTFNEDYEQERYDFWMNYFKTNPKTKKITRTEDDGTEIILFNKEDK